MQRLQDLADEVSGKEFVKQMIPILSSYRVIKDISSSFDSLLPVRKSLLVLSCKPKTGYMSNMLQF